MRKRTMQLTVSLTSVLCFLLITPMSAQRQGAPEPPKIPEGITVHRDLAYVTDGHERQKLDLYVPDEGENLPLIIWVHGGAWKGGNKTHYRNCDRCVFNRAYTVLQRFTATETPSRSGIIVVNTSGEL